jgi:hypothetical protein
MPRRSTAQDAPADFDDLLADKPAEEEVTPVPDEGPAESAPADEEAVLTPAMKRLLEARERAAQRAEAAVSSDPAIMDMYDGLSPEQVAELKALNDEEAQMHTAAIVADERENRYDNSQVGGTGEKILFHVREDGFTAFGDVWYRGQEIEIEVGTPAYKRTFNRFGTSWLNIINDEDAQFAKWGRRMLAPGAFVPRKGEVFEDDLVSMDRRRKRTVPIVSD